MPISRVTAALVAVATAGAGAAVALAPSATAAAFGDTVTGPTWNLSSYAKATFTVAEDGTVTGTDGCNSVFGRATVDPASRTVTFSGMGWTRKLCSYPTQAEADAQATASRTMNAVFAGATRYYSPDSSTLSLTAWNGTGSTWKTGGSSTTTTSGSYSPYDTVTDYTWRLSTPLVSSSVASSAWFRIDRYGKLTGHNSCNQIWGNATVNRYARTISFGQLSSTYIGCSGEQLTASNLVNAALSGTPSFTQSGTTLVLTSSTGRQTTFVR